jgi:hypothetical protein
MPFSTAANIISQYKKSNKMFPKPRGSIHRKYNKLKIADFLFKYLSQPANSNSTLSEMQSEIWEHKAQLGCKSAPSITWISNLLTESLFDSKPMTLKYASVDPVRRNSTEVLEERANFVSWYSSLSDDEKKS